VLVGFSQGGILATLLTACLEHPQAMAASHPALAESLGPGSGLGSGAGSGAGSGSLGGAAGGEAGFAGWRCVVLVGSMLPRDTGLPAWVRQATGNVEGPSPPLQPLSESLAPESSSPDAPSPDLPLAPQPPSQPPTPPQHSPAWPRGLRTPSVHVIGSLDPMAPRSRELARWWAAGHDTTATGQCPVDRSDVGGGGDSSALPPPPPPSLPLPLSAMSTAPSSVVVRVEHGAGHRFPYGKGSAAQYATRSHRRRRSSRVRCA